MALHKVAHPLAGLNVMVLSGRFRGQRYRIEDWWDRIAGTSWKFSDGNPACISYAMSGEGDPIDDEVVYGKIDGLGHLIHVRHLPQGETAHG